MEIIYNKLIRDKVLEFIKADGEKPFYHILDEKSFWNSLIEKDKEELQEVINAVGIDKVKVELADKLEIIRAMAEFHGLTLEDIINIANERREKRGGFSERIFLEKTIK